MRIRGFRESVEVWWIPSSFVDDVEKREGFSIEIKFEGASLPKLGLNAVSLIPLGVFLVLLSGSRDAIWIDGEFSDSEAALDTDDARAELFLEELEILVDLGQFGDFELEIEYGKGSFSEEIEVALWGFNSVSILISLSFYILIAWIIIGVYGNIPNKPEIEYLDVFLDASQKILPVCSSIFFLVSWALTISISSELSAANWEEITGFTEHSFSTNRRVGITGSVGFLSGLLWLISKEGVWESIASSVKDPGGIFPIEKTIGLAISSSLILFSVGASAAIPIVGQDYSGPVRVTYYEWFQVVSEASSGSETITVSSGSTNSVIIDVGESIFSENETMWRIDLTFSYGETGLDSFCDIVSVEASSLPPGTDSADQLLEGQSNDCSEIFLFSATNSSTSIFSQPDVIEEGNISTMKTIFIDSTDGYGEWEFEIGVEAVGSPLDNGEEVDVSWTIFSYELEFIECGPDPELCFFF